MENEKNFFSKKNIIIIVSIICIIFILLIASIISISYFTNPVRKFKSNLEAMNIETANEIYSDTTKYNDKKNMENALNNELNKMLNDFADEKIDYEKIKEKFESLKQLSKLSGKVDKAINDLEELKKSKDYFEKANEMEQTDLFESYKNYAKVNEKDSNNYKVAQKFIKDNTNNIKDTVINDVEKLINDNNYIEAKEKLSALSEIIKNDTTITDKLNEIEEKATKQKIEKDKNEQEVTVESAKTHTEWYSDSISGVRVIVKNNTNKVVKDFIVGVLAYDENNYPLNISSNDFLFLGQGKAVNIQPSQTYGNDQYFSIYYNEEKMKNVIACVKSVEYYDGSKWENPYYEYWLEEYKGKPLH